MSIGAPTHRLVLDLPPDGPALIRRRLRFLWLDEVGAPRGGSSGAELAGDPMLAILSSASADDEPSSPREDASSAAALRAYRSGQGISADAAKRALLG